ncbi:hypothetical protein [Marinilactibacillus piezotolerans]|uniref:hypothetical protein n=1 Tax=Marinilactibacillus piezotolerans TaxID=258723 RepID=UPI001C4DE242|nr:hypothetical protein [Marinilactibacillus piezotolerans]
MTFSTPFAIQTGTSEVTLQSDEDRIFQVLMSTLNPLQKTKAYLVLFTEITEIKRLHQLLEH